MTTLWLIRHAETRAASDACIGQTDVALSAPGEAQADRLAATWSGTPPNRLVASDLRRARQSAAPLASALGRPVVTDARLREVGFGAWEGQRWADLEGDALAAWMADWVHVRPPDGAPVAESFADVAARAGAWLDEAVEIEGTTAVVAHAGSIRALLCHALALPLDRAFAFAIDRAHVSRLDAGPGGWVLTRHNAPSF